VLLPNARAMILAGFGGQSGRQWRRAVRLLAQASKASSTGMTSGMPAQSIASGARRRRAADTYHLSVAQRPVALHEAPHRPQ
jgi:hypothetical protein